MSGVVTTDDEVLAHIQRLQRKKQKITVQGLRNDLHIGYKRALRLSRHAGVAADKETNERSLIPPESTPTSADDDETIRKFILRCRANGVSVSPNSLRTMVHIGYKRATRLVAEVEGITASRSNGFRPSSSNKRRANAMSLAGKSKRPRGVYVA